MLGYPFAWTRPSWGGSGGSDPPPRSSGVGARVPEPQALILQRIYHMLGTGLACPAPDLLTAVLLPLFGLSTLFSEADVMWWQLSEVSPAGSVLEELSHTCLMVLWATFWGKCSLTKHCSQ